MHQKLTFMHSKIIAGTEYSQYIHVVYRQYIVSSSVESRARPERLRGCKNRRRGGWAVVSLFSLLQLHHHDAADAGCTTAAPP